MFSLDYTVTMFIVATAAYYVALNIYKSFKTAANGCSGCGSACSGCSSKTPKIISKIG